MLIFSRSRFRAIAGSVAALMLLLGLAAVTGTASASASTVRAPAASSRPAVGKAPLKDLVGQPVKHVKPPVTPAQFLERPAQPKLPAGAASSCQAPKPGHAQCASISRPVTATRAKASAARQTTASAKPDSAAAAAAATVSGLAPAQLQSAYSLTASSATGGLSDGTPETVAIVGAYNDPNAASDLATYRTQFGLAPCITSVNVANYNLPLGSGCLTQINENNQASPLPAAPTTADGDWTWAMSDQIDMVTAICPNCQILLVEADSSSVADLGQGALAAENDADFVTANWYAPEFAGETADDQTYFNAPGKALVFPSANAGYKSEWPAASQYVTSVGGTTLTADASASRGWDETAYSRSGAACTTLEPKPSWQTDTGANGCPNRTENDAAAVADPADSVAVYDSTLYSGGSPRTQAWGEGSGTTTSSAIITGVYALAGLPQAGTYPSSYPYQSGSSGDFNDVTSGSDGTCESSRQYLCNAASGYDGPTGEGTPDGASGLAFHGSGSVVSVPDPGVKDYAQGDQADIPVQAADSDASQTITYSATGLPDGLSINSATGSITGTVPNTNGTSAVTVTATDSAGATGSTTFNIVVISPMGAGWTAATGHFTLNSAATCMNDASAATADGSPVETYSCENAASENWGFRPSADPGGAGTIVLASNTAKCLDAGGTTTGSKAQLDSCSGASTQKWQIQSGGLLYNPVSRLCLTDPGDATADNTQYDLESCTASAGQQWTLPAGQVLSGISGGCMDDYQQATADKTKVDLNQCSADVSQNWALQPDRSIRIQGVCLDMTTSSTVNGGLADLYSCNGTGAQSWTLEPSGEIVNLTSGKCLDDAGDDAVWGTQLVQMDCDGSSGELWQAT